MPSRTAIRAGTSTSAMDNVAPTPADTASNARQTTVAKTLGGSLESRMDRLDGAAPISPALRRSARTAPSTVAVAAIHVVHARLASQVLGSVVFMPTCGAQETIPSPYARPN